MISHIQIKLFFLSIFILPSLVSTTLHAQTMDLLISAEDLCLIGATQGTKWVNAETIDIKKKSFPDSQIYSEGKQIGTIKSPHFSDQNEPCMENKDLENKIKPVGYASSKKYKPSDASFELLDTHSKVYLDNLGDYLKKNNFKNPPIKIKQLIRTDMNNDGQKEVIIVGSNLTYYKPEAAKQSLVLKPRPEGNNYSVALLRKIVKGKVQTEILWSDLFYGNAELIQNDYKILGIRDLNGDGLKEIIFNTSYYEGSATGIIDLSQPKAKQVLSCGCGA